MAKSSAPRRCLAGIEARITLRVFFAGDITKLVKLYAYTFLTCYSPIDPHRTFVINQTSTSPSHCGGRFYRHGGQMKKLIGIGIGLVAAAALVVTAMAASSNVTVTPSNLQGWTIAPDG